MLRIRTFACVLAVLAIASAAHAARPSCPGGVCPTPRATVQANPVRAVPTYTVPSIRTVRQARVAERLRRRGR